MYSLIASYVSAFIDTGEVLPNGSFMVSNPLLLLVISGFILWFALPEGSEAGRAVIFDRHTWVQAHQWLAAGLLAFFSTHIITHWAWISYMTKNYFRRIKKI